jgi:hypothetical protein
MFVAAVSIVCRARYALVHLGLNTGKADLMDCNAAVQRKNATAHVKNKELFRLWL